MTLKREYQMNFIIPKYLRDKAELHIIWRELTYLERAES